MNKHHCYEQNNEGWFLQNEEERLLQEHLNLQQKLMDPEETGVHINTAPIFVNNTCKSSDYLLSDLCSHVPF